MPDAVKPRRQLGVQELIERFGRKEYDLKKLGAHAQAAGVRSCIVLALRMADEPEPQGVPMEPSGDAP
jgi:hypothetical protein